MNAPAAAPAPESLSRRDPLAPRGPAPPGVLLVEVAWEVANQLGGIYQVLRSKAPFMVERWQDRFFMIGPHASGAASVELDPQEPAPWLGPALERLAAEGLVVHHGRWRIPGRPQVLLLEHELAREALDALKHRTWEDHHIGLPAEDPLIDPVLSFADATRRLLSAIEEAWCRGAGVEGAPGEQPPSRRLLAQFHEWMGGLAIPMIRHERAAAAAAGEAPRAPMAISFTTHATQLGRAIAYNDEAMYDRIDSFDQAVEAARYHLMSKHTMERTCVAGADCFTTVSPITGEECAAFLGRAPEVITPNGLDVERFDVGHDFQTLHAQNKEKIHRFVMGHFFPSYAFDLDRTLYFFTSGRYEPKNKGFDLCISAIARLSEQLKAEGSGVTVVFFIVTQRPTLSMDPRVLRARGVLHELEGMCSAMTKSLGERLFRRAAAGERPVPGDLVEEHWTLRLRRLQAALRTEMSPPVVTHVLGDEATDPVMAEIRRAGLTNGPEDPVKVVFHPEFINPTSPLWGMEYEQFVRGCHLGIFPSSYEPWGYTPLECVAMGVPAVTSDLAGFGRHVLGGRPAPEGPFSDGIVVLGRRGRSFQASASDLAGRMLEICRMDRRARIALRNEVERRSREFDWRHFGPAYDEAHDVALRLAATRSE